MAAVRWMLWLLLLTLVLESGKAEPETENGTLFAGESPTNGPETENGTLLAGEGVSPTNETRPRETPTIQREEGPVPREGVLSSCPCDLHPGSCDLNCCCDSSCGSGCNLGGPECPFSFCLPGSTRAVSWMCLEKSLIFRNNTPYHTEILPGPDGCVSLFCVQLKDPKLNYLLQPQAVTKANFPALLAEYGGSSFTLQEQVQQSPSAFYRVGDPVQTYFAASSVLSVLKQPTRMVASQLCTDENPAGFLESKTTSCIRIFTDLRSSCTTDPALDAASYYRDFSVLKVPVNMTVFQPLQANIFPVSKPASPSLNDNICYNVVSEVTYEVEFNGVHGIQNVSVQFKVANISGNPGSTLQQHFSLHFWSRSPSFTKQRSGNPGYIIGAPLIAMYSNTQQHVTILQNQGNGQCSATERYRIQFGENVRTDCQFSISLKLGEANCSLLQEMLYQAFQGKYIPGSLAIIGNADPTHPGEWNQIVTQKCSVQGEHCMVPISLEIQVLWAQVGLLSNPQAQVLGARYLYLCMPLKSLGTDMNMLSLTTTVAFTDATKRPEPPRGQPRVYWKLPFDFFFPFKVALSGAGNSSGSQTGTLLVALILCEALFL
ncbi:tectonic-3 [Hemicordylus capensis]|uniref:tectonic-3 n=1 Tax=Hemicordylus capensis TaxID=884348 RepID=UPI0023020801|nr:tectonic-3 [Hemicordylus capensis]